MTRPCVLALGFFDGVHIGHGGLLRRTRETADRLGVPAAALTFDTHPDTLVSGHSVPLLNTPEDRAALMREYYGIDEVLTLHFDRETMTQPWERFAEETLLGRYHAVHLVCGHDFRFGDRGAGRAAGGHSGPPCAGVPAAAGRHAVCGPSCTDADARAGKVLPQRRFVHAPLRPRPLSPVCRKRRISRPRRGPGRAHGDREELFCNLRGCI